MWQNTVILPGHWSGPYVKYGFWWTNDKRTWGPTLQSPRGHSPRMGKELVGLGKRHLPLTFSQASATGWGVGTGLPSFLHWTTGYAASGSRAPQRQRQLHSQRGSPYPLCEASKSLCLPMLRFFQEGLSNQKSHMQIQSCQEAFWKIINIANA